MRTLRSTGLLVTALAVALVASAQAQPTSAPSAPAEAPRFDGEWHLAISESEARARIDRGIEAATDGMPPIADGIAARTLRSRTPVVRRVHVRAGESRIVVRLDDRTYDSPPGHPEAAPAASSSEDSVRVVQHFREGRLEQVFTTERGRRWNTFRLGEDGRSMTMHVVVQSSQLPQPLRFTLPYRRGA